jgi:hypothetical protein
MTASTSFSARLSDSSVVTCWPMPYFAATSLGLVQFATDQRDDFNAVNILDAVEVFDAKGTGARERDFDGFHCIGS